MSIEGSWKIDTCGCCRAPVSPTPEAIWNRPGLPAIHYRVGTYSSFRRAMIEKISSVEVEVEGSTLRPLREWTARTSDDYGVALLEMWAYLADILTFYQERAANEAFLRTALLRESVLRLAALLDYEPAPGVAAAAHLVFTLEKDKQVQIPIGLRVQSVPGQGEKPEKFETVEAVAADALLNRLRIFPEVETDDPLTPGRRQALLRPDGAQATAAELVPTDRLVIFTTTDSPRVEEKVVEAVEVTDEGTKLIWSPAVQDDLGGGRMFKWQRQFRLFGYNAPQSYLKAEPVASDPRDVRWTRVEEGQSGYQFDLDDASALKLDALYDNLKVGAWVLVAAPDTAELARIESVEEVNATKGPLNDTVAEITLSKVISTDNLRTVTVYELAEGYDPEEGIALWHHKYADAFPSDTVYIRSTQLDALARGHVLILDDDQNLPQTVACTGVAPVDADGDGTPDHLRITFTPVLTRTLDTETAVLYGNVALATHGETVAREVLGSGDASTAFQSLGVRKSPVTFVPRPGASHGAANTLQVRVGGVLWREVRNLYGHGSDERVYTTSVDNEGKMAVRFGDGKTGARLESGRDNVVATYRQGIGEDGNNVRAGSLSTLLDRPVGLKSGANPAGTAGGADPETLQEARANAPNTVRTFGRIVSLRDFEDAAREFAGVAKARANWEWDGEEQIVHLTVAGDGGAEIVDKPYENLVKDLEQPTRHQPQAGGRSPPRGSCADRGRYQSALRPCARGSSSNG